MERVEQTSEPTCSVCGLVALTATARRPTRIVAESAAMRDLLRRVARFAPSDAPVVILGETGTGKEVVARTLHRNGLRSAAPFVAVNVAALPAELLESELFGHGKGAFTGAATARQGLFEEADGGTLFLDEIGEMPLPLQAKMLRALQDGEIRRVGENRAFAVDVRIVCATHRDLAERVRLGTFREDLYFRLKVLSVTVPPLRERVADILPLARQFLAAERHAPPGFTTSAEERLLAHHWPGNVRELENVVRHGAALAGAARPIDGDDLPDDVAAPRHAPVSGPLRPLAEIERDHVLRVLDACGGSQTDAARILGIARNTLWRKLKGYA
jgi:DNA-binding NtrC family response regulator